MNENSFDAERRLALTVVSAHAAESINENSFDAERRLARVWSNYGHNNFHDENSFDAERRLARAKVEKSRSNSLMKIPSMPKGV